MNRFNIGNTVANASQVLAVGTVKYSTLKRGDAASALRNPNMSNGGIKKHMNEEYTRTKPEPSNEENKNNQNSPAGTAAIYNEGLEGEVSDAPFGYLYGTEYDDIDLKFHSDVDYLNQIKQLEEKHNKLSTDVRNYYVGGGK